MAAENCVRVVIAAGQEFLPDSSFVPKRSAGGIAFKHLDAIASDSVQVVPIDEQTLRAAPAKPGGQGLEPVEDTVVIRVFEPTHGRAIADQKPALSIEPDRITAPRQVRSRCLIDMKTARQLELIVEQRR